MPRVKRKAESPPLEDAPSVEVECCDMHGCAEPPQKADVYGLRFCIHHGARMCATPMCLQYVPADPVAAPSAASAETEVSVATPGCGDIGHEPGKCGEVCALLGCISPVSSVDSKKAARADASNKATYSSVVCSRCEALIATGGRHQLVLVLGNFDAQNEKKHRPGTVIDSVPVRSSTAASELSSLRKQIQEFRDVRNGTYKPGKKKYKGGVAAVSAAKHKKTMALARLTS